MWILWTSIALAGPPPSKESSPVRTSVTSRPACPDSIGVLALPEHIKADDPRLMSKHLIVVLKASRKVMRMSRGRLLHKDGSPACWPAGLGFDPLGHKKVEGDGKTPEGFYRSSDKPTSSFYAAIAVHYPNLRDAATAASDGRIKAPTHQTIIDAINADKKPPQKTALGGEILLHGGGSKTDWTLGCVALNDKDIDALRATLPADMVTDVLILP